MPPINCTSNGIISHLIGCSRTTTSEPHKRRHAFLTTANASGKISLSRCLSSSLSEIFESSSFHAVVLARNSSSESFCSPLSNSLISRTRGQSFLTNQTWHSQKWNKYATRRKVQRQSESAQLD